MIQPPAFIVFHGWKIGKFTFKKICVSLLFEDLKKEPLVEGPERDDLIVGGYMEAEMLLPAKQTTGETILINSVQQFHNN